MAANTTTQWFDLQVKHGNYLPLEKEKTLYETNKEYQDKIADLNTPAKILDNKTIQQIQDEFEDDPDFAEDDFSKQYMAKRMQDIKFLASKPHYGEMIEIARDEYIRQVNEANPQSYVLLSLYQQYNEPSMHLNMILTQLAKKYPLVKFIKIIATKCIEKLPDSAVPMIICYKAGKLVFQINSLDKIIEFTLKNVETFLEEHSLFKVDLEKPKPQEC